MSSHIFPIKLHSLMSVLHNTKVLENRKAPCGITEDQEDGLKRISLFSPEIHKATVAYMGSDDPTLRKRLAYPPRSSSISIIAEQTAFEVYNIDGKLIATTPLCNLERTMSLAIEVELMSLILESNGIKIEMM